MATFLSTSTPSRNISNKSTAPSPVSRKHLEFFDVSTSRSSDSKSRFEAYNRLQAAAVAFGEKLPIPEIVALGGQSDGKSSLLEALLGFRFNVREVEMGTRRPLILQMVHDSSALEPRCRFQEEDSGEYGSPIVIASTVADIIKSRTEAHLKMTKSAVSSKPIVMRAEYAHCPNLTIIDTPGFVLKAKNGEPEGTPDEILEMVKSLASPPHRILVFLQQSSVEWCSSLWLDAIREIDPTLRRTIIVVSKFDNRLKEFNDRWEVDRYLSASGYLGEGIHPFFVALPKDRTTVSNEEFRKQISQVDMEIVCHLRDGVKGGFDEEKFRPFIGFSRLREYLESELQRRYKDAAPATLALLEQRCTEITMELARMNFKIEATSDISYLRKSAMLHTASISSHVGALIDGAADPSPEQWGKTTEEERSESGIGTWPGVTMDIKPPNATLRLYGGAAFERVINEFRCAAFSIQCPAVSREKVANILLAHAGRGGRGVPEASAEIARTAARSWLAPLLDTACDRLAFVLSNLFHLSIERTRCHNTNYGDKSSEMEGYVGFLAALRRSYDGFVRGLSKQCKQLVRHHLDSVTSPYSLAFHDTEEALGTIRPTTSVPRPFCLELADDSVIPQLHEEQENVAPPQKTTPGKSGEPALMTVPETPSPDRQSDHYTGVVKKETGTCGGEVGAKKRQSRMVGLGGRYQEDVAYPLKSLNGGNRFFAGDYGTCGNNAVSSTYVSLSPYSDICSLAAQHFARIREVLVERNVASTLNSGFLTPCRERLVVDLGLDLFAVVDERFMEMFVVLGADEVMQAEKQSLQKRQKILQSCLNEFKTVAGLL